jgi:hypothetical protein
MLEDGYFVGLYRAIPSEFTIIRVHVHQDGLEGNSAHRLLVYTDNINILSGSYVLHRSLVLAGKKMGLEGNADKSKYIIIYRD